MERMRAEEERRQLEDKLQAEVLLQQMEELKLKEMEVSSSPRGACECEMQIQLLSRKIVAGW